MIQEILTPEQIDQQYASTMDSVNLVNGSKPSGIDAKSWEDTVERNRAHIRIMLEKTYWTPDHDLEPFRSAVA